MLIAMNTETDQPPKPVDNVCITREQVCRICREQMYPYKRYEDSGVITHWLECPYCGQVGHIWQTRLWCQEQEQEQEQDLT